MTKFKKCWEREAKLYRWPAVRQAKLQYKLSEINIYLHTMESNTRLFWSFTTRKAWVNIIVFNPLVSLILARVWWSFQSSLSPWLIAVTINLSYTLILSKFPQNPYLKSKSGFDLFSLYQIRIQVRPTLKCGMPHEYLSGTVFTICCLSYHYLKKWSIRNIQIDPLFLSELWTEIEIQQIDNMQISILN